MVGYPLANERSWYFPGAEIDASKDTEWNQVEENRGDNMAGKSYSAGQPLATTLSSSPATSFQKFLLCFIPKRQLSIFSGLLLVISFIFGFPPGPPPSWIKQTHSPVPHRSALAWLHSSAQGPNP